MPRIPQAVVDDILARTDFVGVIGNYLTLRPQGRKFLALCPFHGEKTPSLNLDPDQGLWHCFGCKAGGNLVKFLMQIENWSFGETIRELGRRVGIDVDDLSPQERQEQERRQRLRDIVTRAALMFHERLARDSAAHEARAYLKKRGIGPEVIEAFQIGYAPPGPVFLLEKLQGLGFTQEEIMTAGLATDRTRTGRCVDIMRDRVTFPILDPHGQAVAMGGRLMGDGQPKYLNSPESPLFSKRSTLYGLYQARIPLRSAPAILVEGYMDVVSLHQAGFPQAVASLGTAVTAEQAGLVRRYCDQCILAYDSDAAGQAATDRGIEIFEGVGLAVRVVTMPAGDDPDSLVRRDGPQAFRERLERAMAIMDYRMEVVAARVDLGTPEGKSAFLKEMMPTLARLRDLVRRDQYLHRISEKADVNEQVVRSLARPHLPPAPYAPDVGNPRSGAGNRGSGSRGSSGGYGTGRGSGSSSGSFEGGRARSGPSRFAGAGAHDAAAAARPTTTSLPGGQAAADLLAERQFVRYILAHPEVVPQARTEVDPELFGDAFMRALIHCLYRVLERPQKLKGADLIPLLVQEGLLEQEGVDKRISELLLDDKSEPLTPQLFSGLIKSFQARRDRAELESLLAIVETQKKDGSARHDDPIFQKIQELYQRLKGSP